MYCHRLPKLLFEACRIASNDNICYAQIKKKKMFTVRLEIIALLFLLQAQELLTRLQKVNSCTARAILYISDVASTLTQSVFGVRSTCNSL